MSTIRLFQESPLVQGEHEEIAYSLTTTPWGGSPTSVSVTAFDITGGANDDVSGTVLSGDPAVSGDVITLPVVSGLTAGKKYRLEVLFTSGGNVLEAYGEIEAER